MASYKFRAYYEDDDSIYRDIRISATQGFAELHDILVQAFELAKGKFALKFYKSNDSWQKVGKFKTELVRETTVRNKKVTETIPVMLQQVVDDPHMRMVVHFKSDKDEFMLLLEMMQVFVKDDPKLRLPEIIGSQGPSPFKEDEVKQYLAAKAVDKLEEHYAYADDEEGEEAESGKTKGGDSDSDTDEESTDDEEDAAEDGETSAGDGEYGDKYDVF